MSTLYDSFASQYDRWYDSEDGQALFCSERRCLQSLPANFTGKWVEIGVGTGRFAEALGVPLGVDISTRMLAIASGRGITTAAGNAQCLPLRSDSCDGLLVVLTLCFVDNADQVLRECRRVLAPRGQLLLGVIPAESAWGQTYLAQARDGHPVYSKAVFRTLNEVINISAENGFQMTQAASTLFEGPDEPHQSDVPVKAGASPQAGFNALLFEKIG